MYSQVYQHEDYVYPIPPCGLYMFKNWSHMDSPGQLSTLIMWTFWEFLDSEFTAVVTRIVVTRTAFNLDNVNFLRVPGFRVYCCGQPTISGFEAALPYHNRTSQEGAEQEPLSTTLKRQEKVMSGAWYIVTLCWIVTLYISHNY